MFRQTLFVVCLASAVALVAWRSLAWFGVVDRGLVAADPAIAQNVTPPARERETELEATGGLEALQFRYRQRLSDDGTIPPNALLRAKAQRDRLVRPSTSGQRGGLEPNDWTWLGPGNVGGRIRAILIDPNEPNIMYVGSASGGIWQTTNGGASWAPLSDFMASLAVSCMAMDPTNPNVLYVGTGEGHAGVSPDSNGASNTDVPRGAGIFKSTNGGVTWAQLPATADPDFYYVNDIAIDPIDPNHVIAVTCCTLEGGRGSGVKVSRDGGAVWDHTLAGNIHDVKFHPGDGNVVLIAFDNNVFRSTDGGTTWEPNSATLGQGGRIELAFAPSSPDIAYASVSRGEQTEGLFRSTDGGQTFQLANTTSYMNQGTYANALWVAPDDPNTVVVGGLDLWRSSYGGATLLQVSDSAEGDLGEPSVHADHHVIVHHPGYNGSSNRTVYFGNDGGIHKAADITTVTINTGWQALNNQLGITQFYGAAVAPDRSVIGGTQDNGTVRFSGDPNDWTSTFSGDGGFVAVDFVDPNYVYGEAQNMLLCRSTDGGHTLDHYLLPGLFDAEDSDPNYTGHTNFIAPFVMHPVDPNILLAGGARLWRTVNAKAPDPNALNWTIIKQPIGEPGSWEHWISTIAISPHDPNVIWVGHNNGKVYRTTNGDQASPQWTQVSTVAMPHRFVSDIEIADPNTVYVSFMGYEPNNLWKGTASPTGAMTFAALNGAPPDQLPELPVSSVVRGRCGNLFVGTDLGVFTSEDDGATWSATNNGPANVAVDQLIAYGTDLYAVTWGRGIYRASAATRAGSIERVSVSPVGEAGDDSSMYPRVSADGGAVAFASGALDLETPPPPHRGNWYLRQLCNATTLRIPIPDAPWVTWNLASPGFRYFMADHNGAAYWFDRFTHSTDPNDLHLLNLCSIVPLSCGFGDTHAGLVDDGGRMLWGTTLGPVPVHRAILRTSLAEATASTVWQSQSADGWHERYENMPRYVHQSSDGAVVAFNARHYPNPYPNDSGAQDHVCIVDGTGVRQVLSTPVAAAPYEVCSVSRNGRFIVTEHRADPKGIFVYDRSTARVARITGADADPNTDPNIGEFDFNGRISDDGRYLFYTRVRAGFTEVVTRRYDVLARISEPVVIRSDGQPAAVPFVYHGDVDISADGRIAVFESDATDLIVSEGGFSGPVPQVYVRYFGPPAPAPSGSQRQATAAAE